VTSSLAVFEAEIRVKASDIIRVDNQKKRNVEIKDIFT